MARVTREAGSVLILESGSGPTFTASFLPTLVGGVRGRPAAGLGMRLDASRDAFEIVVLDSANVPLLALGGFPEDEVVAEWRRLGASSRLELKIMLPNGAVMSPYPQLGPLLVGPTRQRRRHGLLAHRRPRFLARRQTGFIPFRPSVYRESELAEGEA